MNNLEQQIITRLKHYLLKYNLDIVTNLDVDDVIFRNTDLVLAYNNNRPSCIYFWTSVDDMLFAPDNIFTFLPSHIEHSANNICQCVGDSLEEIVMKMDLIGI